MLRLQYEMGGLYGEHETLSPLLQWLSPSRSSDNEEQLLQHEQFLLNWWGKRLPQGHLHSADEVINLQLNVQLADVITVLELGLGFLSNQFHPVTDRGPQVLCKRTC